MCSQYTYVLGDDTNGAVIRSTLFSKNSCYIWSTENGYDFLIENRLTINERNFDKISKLVNEYAPIGTSDTITRAIRLYRDRQIDKRTLLDAFRGKRIVFDDRLSSGLFGQQRGQTSGTSGVGIGDSANTIETSRRGQLGRVEDNNTPSNKRVESFLETLHTPSKGWL